MVIFYVDLIISFGMFGGMEREGVTRYQLKFKKSGPLPAVWVDDINAWRRILYKTGLIGQDPARYGGIGYGNISRRIDRGTKKNPCPRFVVSGTQTGRLPRLSRAHYVLITKCGPRDNFVEAHGPVPPSSESMTHGMLYSLVPSARYIMHVHSPLIWHQAKRLGIPQTRKNVLYGTPEMADEVERLVQTGRLKKRPVFAMGGHEDGLVSFSSSLEEAGLTLLRLLFQALRIPAR